MNITDAELYEIIASAVEADTALDKIVDNTREAAFVACLLGVTPTQYLRIACRVLRDMGLVRQAASVKAEYLTLVRANE